MFYTYIIMNVVFLKIRDTPSGLLSVYMYRLPNLTPFHPRIYM